MYQALEMAGREMTQAEVLKEVEKDRLFFEESGGGVTFSGGESLAQPEFLEALLDELRSRNIHTAIDTSGLAAPGLMEKMALKSDLILYDLKMMNEERHKKYTGVSNRLILDNLKRLAGLKRKIWIRIPLIAGVNDDDENILETAVFLKSLGGITNIGLLPYHKGGYEKIKRLGKEDPFQCFESPSAERMENIRKYLADSGFTVKIGG
jgi:pyruvate formate lyase activating enzyme